MDERASFSGGPQEPLLSQRSDRCGMSTGGAADPAGQTERAAALNGCARGAERHLLRAVDPLPMGGDAKDLPPKSTVCDYLDLWKWVAPWSASITLSMLPAASKPDARPVPRPRSSTARAPARPKKGRLIDPQGLMRARRLAAASGTSRSIRSA